MKIKLLTVGSGALALLLLSAPAFAQSTTPKPPTPPGTTGKPIPGTPGAKTNATSPNLDLPFERPSSEPSVTETPEPPPEPPPPDEPPTFGGEPIPGEGGKIYYVIDASGSMTLDQRNYVDNEGNVRRGNRMDRAKAEMVKSISALPKSFKFNFIFYGCSAFRYSPTMQEASAANKTRAIAVVMAIRPAGGTMTGPATAFALADKENKSVVLLTDGSPNCGAFSVSGHLTAISRANTQSAVITVFGIGATGLLRRFCQDVARANNGNYVDVP